ncbi:MAG TPA: peptide deformylase [Bacilli bacterium]|nr:peptide deformylase [Bacilli bacterium]
MIKATDIIVEGNPLLREKSQEVNIPLTKEDEALLLEMVEYIDNSMDEEIAKKYNLTPSVGIAAVQVGIPKKMLVVWAIDEKGYEHLYPMINPKIVSYSDEMSYLPMGEACLSVPRQAPGYIHRPARVTVDTFLYEKGALKRVRLRLKNYIAIVFQHEYDHLNGILFVDRINQANPFFVPENSKPIIFPEETSNVQKA